MVIVPVEGQDFFVREIAPVVGLFFLCNSKLVGSILESRILAPALGLWSIVESRVVVWDMLCYGVQL